MNDRERERLLDRLRRPSGTVGRRMPDELDLDGTTVDLTALVFECERLETIPEAERDRIEETKRLLRRERLRRKQRLEREAMSYEEGERLVRSVLGIDRAHDALASLDDPDFDEQVRRERLDRARELLSLVRQAP